MAYYFFLLGMLVLPFLWMRFFEKRSTRQVFKELFPKPGVPHKEIIGALKLFLLLVAGFIVVSFVVLAAGVDDLDKVQSQISADAQNPILFVLVIPVVLFAEELFFRVFLQKRIGIVASTAVFALAHLSYGSVSEVIGAFFLGLILGWWFKKNGSLVQNYAGHLFYDLFAIILYLVF